MNYWAFSSANHLYGIDLYAQFWVKTFNGRGAFSSYWKIIPKMDIIG